MLKLGQDKVASKLPSSPQYVAFSCDNAGREDQEINAKWTIWIPVTLLNEQEDWIKEENKIEIKTQTSRRGAEGGAGAGEVSLFESGLYKTTFESASFSINSIKGEWGGSLLEGSWEDSEDNNSYIWEVKITDPESENNLMYLRLDVKDQEYR